MHRNEPSTQIELRPYQRTDIDAICRAIATGGATLYTLATGLGKTTVFVEFLRRRHEQHGRGFALVVVHREELVTQAAERIRTQTGLRVGTEMAQQRDATSARPMLAGFRPDVVVCSVQSLSRPARLAKLDASRVHSVVIDEAHRSTSASYLRIMDALPDAAILGVTATPDRADGVGLGDVYRAHVRGLTLREGIEQGYLAPITAMRIVCDEIDISKVRMRGGDLDEAALQAVMGREAVHHQIAAALHQHTQGRRGILFLAGVQSVHDFVEIAPAYGIAARGVDGSTDRDVRRETIAAFRRGEVTLLVNDSVFVEGFDEPTISYVAIARPTTSRAFYAQMVGRGTRLAPGKDDCLLLDFAGNSGRHVLAGPLDVLGGEPIPDRVREAAQREIDRGVDIVTAERRAKETISAEALREALAERDAVRQRRAHVTVDVSSCAQIVDPFTRDNPGAGLDVDEGGPRATPQQRADLAAFRVDVEDISAAQASRLIERLRARARKGLCTWKQGRFLAKHGCNPELPRRAADAAIAAIKANGWRRPRDWVRDAFGFYVPAEVSNVA